MRNPTNILVLLFTFLATLSLVLTAPIPTTQNDLLERSFETDDLVARSHMVQLEARTPPKLKAVVTMMKGAQQVLKNAGIKSIGGKPAVEWHKDHVAQHLQKTPSMSGVKKAAISAPAHAGGHGGGGHPPDPNPHITAKLKGPGQSKQTVHIPVPPGTPLVKPSDFHSGKPGKP